MSEVFGYNSTQVWDGVSDARIVFNSNDLDLSTNGQEPSHIATMTENLNLQRALLQSLGNLGGVDILDNTKVSRIEKEADDGGWPIVHTSDGRKIRTRLLVSCMKCPYAYETDGVKQIRLEQTVPTLPFDRSPESNPMDGRTIRKPSSRQ